MRVLIVLATLLAVSPVRAADPAPFPHTVHVVEEELKCLDCHGNATTSGQASDDLNPKANRCAECHDPGEVPTNWSMESREYYFSHADHAGGLGLDCARCHSVLEERPVRPLPAMDDCMTCHNGTAAPRDCASCHTSEIGALRPRSHDPTWLRNHGPQARITDNSCVPCHAVSDCQECHEGALLNELSNRSGPQQAPFGPSSESTSALIVERVHGLNFRFLHGLEARGKNSDCVTCHELDTGDFCAECHNPDSDLGIRPQWHGGSNWLAGIGTVGSGGGRHAELARRDIENCATCHDTQGDDPTCLLCHMDRRIGKGNDPKTHSGAFANDIGDGDFHDDSDAVCFTCHVFKGEAGGPGFCGYCHGAQ